MRLGVNSGNMMSPDKHLARGLIAREISVQNRKVVHELVESGHYIDGF